MWSSTCWRAICPGGAAAASTTSLDVYVELDLLARDLPRGRRSGIDHITLHVSNPAPALLHLGVRWEKE
jgi:hypothetical protein